MKRIDYIEYGRPCVGELQPALLVFFVSLKNQEQTRPDHPTNVRVSEDNVLHYFKTRTATNKIK